MTRNGRRLALGIGLLASAALSAQTTTEFRLPSGPGFDVAAGTLRQIWVTQPGANRIARVTAWGEIRELPIPTEFADPRGIAGAADGGAWFTEYGAHQIGRVLPDLQIVEYPLPTAGAGPFGITTDSEGNAWFTESDANAIGRITPAGVVTEFPIPTAGATARRIVAGPDGNLWFTETDANQIGRITPAGVVTEFPVPTPSSHPVGITADFVNLWFTEASGNAIGRITPSGTITEFPLPGAGVSPAGIALGSDGALWYTQSEGHRIGRMSTTGDVIELDIPTPASRPRGIAAGRDRNLWFVEEDGGNVARLSPVYQNSESIDFAPWILSAADDGKVFWVVRGTNRVVRMEPQPNGSGADSVLIPTAGSSPEGIAAGPDGDAWFTENVGNKIGRLSAELGIVEFPLPTAGSGPLRIALGPDGNYWFTESAGNRIGRITPLGAITEFPIPSVDSNPSGIVAGSDGNLWFAEYNASKIGRITPGGAITEFPTPTAFAAPSAVAAGPDGNVWFTETSANAIGRITPQGEIVEFPIPTAASQPVGITAGADGNLWFTEFAGNRLGRITTAGRIDEVPLAAPASGAFGITAGRDGNLYFSGSTLLTRGVARPAGLGVTPPSGSAAGGDALTIMAFDLEAGASARLGGVVATGAAVDGETRLTATGPALSPGTLNDVEIERADGSVAVSRDAWLADFLDVPGQDPLHFYIESIFRAGVTAGCGGGSYCSGTPVTRAQMAVFLRRAARGPLYVPPPCQGAFADVPCPSPFADWIEDLLAAGVTGGCGGGNYCPSSPVTRAQMAVFIMKSVLGLIFEPPPCTGVFADVPCPGGFAVDWIEALAARGITGGCGNGNYCPANPSTRGQMAVFVTRAFLR